LNENQSALYWVAPLSAQQNSANADKVMSAWNGATWDTDTLYALAFDWNADYILVEGDFPTLNEPVYSAGHYQVFIVENQQ